jgi:hypothetical protein
MLDDNAVPLDAFPDELISGVYMLGTIVKHMILTQ